MKLFYSVFLILVIVQAEVTIRFKGNVDVGQSGNNFLNVLRHARPTTRVAPKLVSQKIGLVNTAIYETEEELEMDFGFNGTDMDIFPEKRKVKDDGQFRNFIVHVYKQHLKVFQKLKRTVTPAVQDDVDMLTNKFRDKFIEFVNNTQNFNIKTRQGGHKVVMNTINTSNNIMRRLLDRLVVILRKKGALRIGGNDMVGLIKKQIIQEKEAEMEHACTKLGICRKDDGFSHFVSEIIALMLRSSDAQIIQARDAFTEVLKDEDFSYIMDEDTLDLFHKDIASWELSKPQQLKSVMIIIKNIIHNKFTPITVPASFRARPRAINRTVGILELLDSLDEALPSTKKNKETFDDITSLVKQWSRNERKDIQDIMKGFVKLIQTGIKMSDKRIEKVIRSSISEVVS